MRFALWKNRQEGEEAPHIPLGPFQIRLPFIHYRFEWPDYFQGLLMCAVDLAAIPLLTTLLGMPFEVALAIVMLKWFVIPNTPPIRRPLRSRLDYTSNSVDYGVLPAIPRRS